MLAQGVSLNSDVSPPLLARNQTYHEYYGVVIQLNGKVRRGKCQSQILYFISVIRLLRCGSILRGWSWIVFREVIQNFQTGFCYTLIKRKTYNTRTKNRFGYYFLKNGILWNNGLQQKTANTYCHASSCTYII